MQTPRYVTIGRVFVRLLNVLFVIAMLTIVGITLFRRDLVDTFITWIGTIVNSLGAWNYVIAFVSSGIESFPIVGIFVPGQQVMLLVGGFFGRSHLLEIIVIASVGACIGNYIGYIMGRHWGRGFFERYGDWIGIGRTELGYLERQIQYNGAWFIILGKFHALTRSLVPFIAGSMGMQARSFWVYNIIGSVLWATTIIILGVLFTQYYHMIIANMPYILLGIIALVALYIACFQRE